MNGRKTVVALSLLCALALSAFASPSASAKGTTGGECAKGGTKDFSDAHCDKAVAAGTGEFGHVLFANNVEVAGTTSNDLTGTSSPFVLEGKVAGIATKVECKKVTGTGSGKNTEVAGAMKPVLGISTGELTECRDVTLEKCSVTVAKTESKRSDPMNLKLGAEKEGPTGEKLKVVEEAVGGTEFGGKVIPSVEGGNITSLTFTGAECPEAIKGVKVIKGFFYITSGRGSTEATNSSGATGLITKASSLGGLVFAGNPATLEGTVTLRKAGGNPLIATTTEK